MVGKNEFGHYFTGIHHAQGTSADDHTVSAAGGASGCEIFSSFYFYYTDPAGSGIIFNAGSFQVDVAQGRYINPYLTCSFQ